MAADTVSLEHFTTPLRNSRILCYGVFTKYPPIMEYIKDIRNPITKKVLITNTVFGLNSYFPFHYDAVFQARDQNDWTMILTYITYVVKPALVVCDVAVPEALWKKLSKDVTFIHLSTVLPMASIRAYDCIFFAEDAEVQRVLQTVYRASYSVNENKEILQELRVANAGLVWTRVDEAVTGALYWYDPVPKQSAALSKKQMGELFGWLAAEYRD